MSDRDIFYAIILGLVIIVAMSILLIPAGQ
jgi:hypothetical protein